MFVLFKAAATPKVVGDTLKVEAAACVTTTVLLADPELAIVTVAERVVDAVLAAAVTVMVALLEPEALLTVNQP